MFLHKVYALCPLELYLPQTAFTKLKQKILVVKVSCVTSDLFSRNSIIFICFSGFYTDSVAKSHDYRPMFVCELTRNKEYLLCYSVYGVFVDVDGKKTRNGEMKWPYCPKNFGILSKYFVH